MTSRLTAMSIAGLILGACGDPGGGSGGDDDAVDAIAADTSTPDAAGCVAPEDCDWLEAYQREIVGKLSGERPIGDGVTLAARATIGERNIVRSFLQEELTRLGYQPALHDYNTGASVLATLPATAGDGALLVVCAHFDSIENVPAAADNGTGVAVVLAAARYLRGLPDRDRPIVFALFDQEEIGLVGSQLYADQLVADGTAVDAVHNYDMISWDADDDGAAELWSPSPPLEALYRLHGAARGVPIVAVPFQSSDHQSFLNDGFTTVGVSEEFVSGDHTPHYHQPTDTYDKIEFGYLASITQLAFAVLADTVDGE